MSCCPRAALQRTFLPGRGAQGPLRLLGDQCNLPLRAAPAGGPKGPPRGPLGPWGPKSEAMDAAQKKQRFFFEFAFSFMKHMIFRILQAAVAGGRSCQL